MKKSIMTLLLVVLATTTPHAAERYMGGSSVEITFTAEEYRRNDRSTSGLSIISYGMNGKDLYDFLQGSYSEVATLLEDGLWTITGGGGDQDLIYQVTLWKCVR